MSYDEERKGVTKLPKLAKGGGRHLPPGMLLSDMADEADATMPAPKGWRSAYPAEMVVLPGHGALLWYTYADFLRSLTQRVWVQDADGPVEALPRREDSPNSDSHWFWCGATQGPDRRGVIRVKRKVRYVNRVLWTVCRGGSPDTRRVVHRTCDAVGCVNPFHAALVRQGSWQT